jgi:hypothetical protein
MGASVAGSLQAVLTLHTARCTSHLQTVGLRCTTSNRTDCIWGPPCCRRPTVMLAHDVDRKGEASHVNRE